MCLGTVSVWSLYAYVTEAFRSGLSILLHFICEAEACMATDNKVLRIKYVYL